MTRRLNTSTKIRQKKRCVVKAARTSIRIECHGNWRGWAFKQASKQNCTRSGRHGLFAGNAYNHVQELGNVETVVCVLIKSNETNLRSIMRPVECYGNASCRRAPLNGERTVIPSRLFQTFRGYFIEQSIENISNSPETIAGLRRHMATPVAVAAAHDVDSITINYSQ